MSSRQRNSIPRIPLLRHNYLAFIQPYDPPPPPPSQRGDLAMTSNTCHCALGTRCDDMCDES